MDEYFSKVFEKDRTLRQVQKVNNDMKEQLENSEHLVQTLQQKIKQLTGLDNMLNSNNKSKISSNRLIQNEEYQSFPGESLEKNHAYEDRLKELLDIQKVKSKLYEFLHPKDFVELKVLNSYFYKK